MWRYFLRLTCLLSLIGLAETSRADMSGQSGPSDVAECHFASAALSPKEHIADPTITVIARVPSAERPLPTLPPTEFTDCLKDGDGLRFCALKLEVERHIVIEKCFDRDASAAPTTVIQACTESLEHNILQGKKRSFLFVNRADAYFVLGERQRALDDYNQAIRLAPHNADLYYNRGVFFAAQTDGDAALKDYDAALGIDPKLVPALRARAKLYNIQQNFTGSVADYSDAIGFQPNAAVLWSERGLVYLLQREYQNAVDDEAEAIRLEPKLAIAYFLRGSAYEELGYAPSARIDIAFALHLDPTLRRYLTHMDLCSHTQAPREP